MTMGYRTYMTEPCAYDDSDQFQHKGETLYIRIPASATSNLQQTLFSDMFIYKDK